MTGFEDGPPVRGGGALADFVGGLYLALGVAAALLERERSGPRARPRPLEPGLRSSRSPTRRRRSSPGSARGWSASATSTRSPRPTSASPTRDGYVVVGTASNKLFRRARAPRSAGPSSAATSASAPPRARGESRARSTASSRRGWREAPRRGARGARPRRRATCPCARVAVARGADRRPAARSRAA